jgi:hypothetical protein
MLALCTYGNGPQPQNFLTQMQFAVPNSYSGKPYRFAGQPGASGGGTFRKIFTATQPPSSYDARGCTSGRVTDKENPNG